MEFIVIIIVVAILAFFGWGNTNFFLGRLAGDNKKGDSEIVYYYRLSKGEWDIMSKADKQTFRNSYHTRQADDSAVAAYFGLEMGAWGFADSATQADLRNEYRNRQK